MLAKKQPPKKFGEWNKKYGAPFGFPVPFAKKLKRWLPSLWYWKIRGPFGIQKNNTTRSFEYPWVFWQLEPKKEMRIVDVGGGLGGFQFVLSALGCEVFNVDPGMEAAGKGWPCDQATMNRLNNCFGTNVVLKNTTMDRADLLPNSYDAVISVSVIEHLPWVDVEKVMEKAWEVLKPGGLFVLTVDLFLDIDPFTSIKSNKYGSNINIRDLVSCRPFKVLVGQEKELFGFDDFDSNNILALKSDWLVGEGYPAMVQCLVLQKPAAPG